METPADIFAAINERLRAEPQRTQGITAVYGFNISGEDGGSFYIKLGEGVGEAGSGAASDPNVVVDMQAQDFVDMAKGELDGTMAFMSGKIKLQGDMGLAMKLQDILAD